MCRHTLEIHYPPTLMNLNYTIAALAATTLATNAATVVLDNLDFATPVTTGSQSNYQKQSFTPNVAGIGTSDTVTTNSPLPATVFLEGTTFITAPTGTGSTAGQIFLNVYLGAGNAGVFVGSSSNSVDLIAAGFNTNVNWSFDNLNLDSGSEYALVFSTTATDDSAATARLTAANNGGGFVSTYAGGTADDNADGGSPGPFDSRFQVQFNTVPEPSSTALLGLGGLALLLRRRK